MIIVKKEETAMRLRESLLRLFVTVILLTAYGSTVFSQNFSVYTVQHISFGAFFPGAAGGTVKISAKGERTFTGDIIPIQMGYAYFPASFDIEAPAGTIISIMSSPDVVLQGSNGGSMLLRLGESLPRAPFSTVIPPPGRTQLWLGGTLHVNSTVNNKPGVYSGNVSIIFNQE